MTNIVIGTGKHRRPPWVWRILTKRVSVGWGLNAVGIAVVAGVFAGWQVAS